MKKALLALAVGLISIAPIAEARGFGGHPVYGGGFRTGFYGGGFYQPFWGSYWGPGYGSYYYAYPNSGQVKLDTKVKDAEVFINGAFAGTTRDNKTMHLRPGDYNIEVRFGGQPRFAQRVFVVAGKTLHINPAL